MGSVRGRDIARRSVRLPRLTMSKIAVELRRSRPDNVGRGGTALRPRASGRRGREAAGERCSLIHWALALTYRPPVRGLNS